MRCMNNFSFGSFALKAMLREFAPPVRLVQFHTVPRLVRLLKEVGETRALLLMCRISQ